MTRLPDMVTTNGHFVWYDNPSATYVSEDDLKLSTANICRYNGGLPWRLHKHLLLCASLVLVDLAMIVHLPTRKAQREKHMLQAAYAGTHDFHEVYMTDVVSGLKKHLPAYASIEESWERHVLGSIGLPYDKRDHKFVKHYDVKALLVEMKALKHPAYELQQAQYPKILVQDPHEKLLERIQRMSDNEVWQELQQIITEGRTILSKRLLDEPQENEWQRNTQETQP